jgi:cytochrome P450
MPSFKANMVGRFSPFVQSSAQSLLLDEVHRDTADGDAVQFCPLAKRFAFEISAKFVFGPLLDDEERKHAFTMFQEFANGLSPAVLGEAMQDQDNPGTAFEVAVDAKGKLNEYLSGKYIEAQELTATNTWDSTYGEDSECILRSFLENDAEFSKPDYTMADRVDFMLSITFAAYDTSATSMTNMIYSMWQNPEETDKVRAAIMAHPELSDPNTVFTFDMLKSCNEMECFISESMRVHSFLPQMAPRVVHDEDGVEMGGYHLPKGTSLVIPIQFLHQGEGSWTDPLEFKPSRFDKSKGQKRADRGSIGAYNHIPFATGLHKCLGQHLAMLELRTYTTLLLRDWEIELDESRLSDEGVVNHQNLTQSIPHYNVYLKLRKRQK